MSSKKRVPIISIVGRQNVGKSTLFNALLKKKLAITEDYPGVTRDVLRARVLNPEKGLDFVLCDTPGLDIERPESLEEAVLENAFRQVAESDLVVFLLDLKEVTSYDSRLIDKFRKDPELNQIPVLYCVNKVDHPEDEEDLDSFYKMGLSEILPISAIGRRNLPLLLEKIAFLLPTAKRKVQTTEEGEISSGATEDFSLAIVGKPNAGKSSLLNALCGYDRAVVSEVAGTTRDSVDTTVTFEGKKIRITDTAGIRRKSDKAEALEFYSYQRTKRTIQNSDVVIHLLDALKGFGEFDKKIVGMLQEEGKPFLLAVNKWDAIEDKDNDSFKNYQERLYSRFPLLKEIQIITLSAKEKQRIHKMMEMTIDLASRSKKKISTSELNQSLRAWMAEAGRSFSANKPPKMLYCTQVSVSPFHLILFVNHVDYFKSNLLTFIKKKLTEKYNLKGIPIRLELRSDRK
ncbi:MULTISPECIES: ribosome biogenesis GTPase Der [unclassified Leptospira]|uniref:ribosome biogenesis GTPase Der n=1 Tax=unclassified Leptospira TaxID=2633828 RepID=UPI0002BF90BA|nr:MULTISPECIES: ribosome biogenesis GTPase Der [unclassified Leptospira]EMJ98665.1 ribosome-associated GTPase EngA [Leptospira sp. B5-022]MCR1795087.1 ribosome biogenesis GTPase Der [Leptospira sp. id769339]